MRKKIICNIIIFFFILSTLQTNTLALNVSKSVKAGNNPDTEVFLDIENTEGKFLLFDDVIGEVHVKYWEHIEDDVLIKNDSILLHLDVETGDIIKYRKSWTDDLTFDFNNIKYETENHIKKQKIVFPDEMDCNFFYTFYEEQIYPVFCWEVWYKNGETILYDQVGQKIGYGIPTPSDGFSLSGYDYNPQYPDDPWIGYRKNADQYFEKWCISTESISLPSKDTVSSYVQDSSVQLFYEIAHGDYISFLVNKQWERYYFSTARKDMENRQPMKFAFMGSCKAMNHVGPDSFSYEFRKGEMENTVTIGYCNLTQSAWVYAYDWQDFMFDLMDKKEPIYDAFISACAEYPGISKNVVFVGDENLTVIPKPKHDYINKITKPLHISFLKYFPFLTRLYSIRDIIF